MKKELKTKKELADAAFVIAGSHALVYWRGRVYLPVDFETLDVSHVPKPNRTVWVTAPRSFLVELAGEEQAILFGTDGEKASFELMVQQHSMPLHTDAQSLLVRTDAGLKELTPDGALQDPSGKFIPNYLVPMLNTDQAEKEKTFATVAEWLDSEEEAEALLAHLATSLSPGYTAVKYILLLGEGRNGKSVLLKMLTALFGGENVSHVTRQDISEKSPTVIELNGKLLNIVFDGQAEYLKDSGTEKSLIAGEAVQIRRLYESTPTQVQTNALFVEALNKEPKSTDKSSALQKRLVRFQFPNTYALDHAFERSMLTEERLGAFLSLLIDRYVKEDEVAGKLALTSKAMELQLDHMYSNSLALQFVKHIEDTDALGIDGFIGDPLSTLTQSFQSWRIKEGDTSPWSEPDVAAQFQPLLLTDRKSVRVNGAVRKTRVITGLKPETEAFINSMKEDGDAAAEDLAAMVAD